MVLVTATLLQVASMCFIGLSYSPTSYLINVGATNAMSFVNYVVAAVLGEKNTNVHENIFKE